jgi:hypothetical protein
VFEKIEQVNLGASEMKDELANIKLGIDEMNNKEERICCSDVDSCISTEEVDCCCNQVFSDVMR